MPEPVAATVDVAARLPIDARELSPGCPVAGEVIVASTAALGAWPVGTLAANVWIVLGDGELPTGAQILVRLPDRPGPAELEAAIIAGREVVRLRRLVAELESDVARAQEQQMELVQVGIALTAQRDLDRLLQLILTTARELVNADAGSLYLIEEPDGKRVLRFTLAQNDSVPVSFAASVMPIDTTSLAGYVATTGESVGVNDVRQLPADVPYKFNSRFDLAIGYHTRSVLTSPIATRAGEVIGVLQLINRKTDRAARITDAQVADRFVVPFAAADIRLIQAMAAQAAVAIENTRLVREIERLFEGFVRASVRTIEQRDPTTSGHSLRVAHYTVNLAQATEKSPPAAYRGLSFTRDQMTQLRYAALLHDFGKIGVREAVLTKGKKLFPERLALVRERFRLARRSHEVEILRGLLASLAQFGRAPAAEDLVRVEAAIGGVKADLDAQLAAVLAANEPTVLEQSTAHLVAGLQSHLFPAGDGEEVALVLPEEVRALSVPKGSLDEAERREIESHVVHSYQFLLTIPWPRRFGRVPEIAYGHHEKLNGRGYPNRLVAGRIPPEVRMMTVCDIYDALTVGDRPYKRALPPERALEIIQEETRDGALDAELVQVFIGARVFAQPMGDPVTG